MTVKYEYLGLPSLEVKFVIQNASVTGVFRKPGADAIKKFTPSLGIPDLGV